MTIEAMGEQRREPAAHVHKVGYANRAIKKKRCKRTRRGASTVSMALQDLFVSCKQVFKGPDSAPLPQDIKRLCNLLDNMKPEDVGLSSELQFFKTKDAVKETPRVTYTTIYKCDDFSGILKSILNSWCKQDFAVMIVHVESEILALHDCSCRLCIFFLPATAVIPLHNHPGMTVFSKLLLGTMHIKSYDWVDPPRTDGPDTPTQLRLAKLEADSVLTAPCNTSVLYPTAGGNIHQFTAITPCAVLDVLGPPYSKEDGRDCSYYKDFPHSALSNGEMELKREEGKRYAWLEETEVPENSKMDGIEGFKLLELPLVYGSSSMSEAYNMKPEDVGLSSELQFFKTKDAVKETPTVTYTTIYKCDDFSLCIFFLPATAVIPLHNHPGMTVFSKLLLGTMHIKSYDWVDPPRTDGPDTPTQLRLAKLEADSVLTAPCNTSVLYPTAGGNIHQFTAITPCAVLDVLGPPYSKEDGRDCSYYKDFPHTALSNGEMELKREEGKRYAWLEETEVPENSKMDGIEYLGPQGLQVARTLPMVYGSSSMSEAHKNSYRL
ncbi:hypothetical protein DKX38_029258 [Salix brachista]|uniref:cysteine dioxygenase n=1 Tax=Salix brachista TaxID=2182728 RepID=A0A5N5J281_9ROSI|nr:hypothetical protein DKX38_029258 [Salix brachista]